MARKPFNPDKEIRDYCDHIIHSHIQVLKKNKKEKTWYWDYPATAAICHDDACFVKRGSFSHYPEKKRMASSVEIKVGGDCRNWGQPCWQLCRTTCWQYLHESA